MIASEVHNAARCTNRVCDGTCRESATQLSIDAGPARDTFRRREPSRCTLHRASLLRRLRETPRKDESLVFLQRERATIRQYGRWASTHVSTVISPLVSSNKTALPTGSRMCIHPRPSTRRRKTFSLLVSSCVDWRLPNALTLNYKLVRVTFVLMCSCASVWVGVRRETTRLRGNTPHPNLSSL